MGDSIIDKVKTNLRKELEGFEDLRDAWKARWRRLGTAADDKDIMEVGHNIGGFLHDAVVSLDRLIYKLALWALIIYAGSWTGWYEWPVTMTWTGFSQAN